MESEVEHCPAMILLVCVCSKYMLFISKKAPGLLCTSTFHPQVLCRSSIAQRWLQNEARTRCQEQQYATRVPGAAFSKGSSSHWTLCYIHKCIHVTLKGCTDRMRACTSDEIGLPFTRAMCECVKRGGTAELSLSTAVRNSGQSGIYIYIYLQCCR